MIPPNTIDEFTYRHLPPRLQMYYKICYDRKDCPNQEHWHYNT